MDMKHIPYLDVFSIHTSITLHETFLLLISGAQARITIVHTQFKVQ